MKKNLFTLLCVTFMFMLMSSCSPVEHPIEQDPQTKFIGSICTCPNPGPNHVCKPILTYFCGDCGEKVTSGTDHDCDIDICPKCGEIEQYLCCPILRPCPNCRQAPHTDWCIYAPCPVCDSYPHHTSWCDVSLCPTCKKADKPGHDCVPYCEQCDSNHHGFHKLPSL